MAHNKEDYKGVRVQEKTKYLDVWPDAEGKAGDIIRKQGYKCPKCGEFTHKEYHCWKEEDDMRDDYRIGSPIFWMAVLFILSVCGLIWLVHYLIKSFIFFDAMTKAV